MASLAGTPKTKRTKTTRRATSRRPPRSALLRRWLAVGAVVLVAYLYWQPLTTYLERRGEVERASAKVQALQTEHRALQRQLALQQSDAVLVREARRLGYVRPGERLYIVKGIPEWRRAHAARASGGTSSVRSDG